MTVSFLRLCFLLMDMHNTLRLVVFHLAISSLCSAVETYTNSWAVEVDGTTEELHALTQLYEFTNKGKVGILDHTYEFVLPKGVYQREGLSMDEPYDRLTQKLMKEDIVVTVEQQKLHRIVEKSYTDPTDPDWSKQWYLVSSSRCQV
jgi:hypothetical protein